MKHHRRRRDCARIGEGGGLTRLWGYPARKIGGGGGGGVERMVATQVRAVATVEVVLYHLSTSPSSGYGRFECPAKTDLPTADQCESLQPSCDNIVLINPATVTITVQFLVSSQHCLRHQGGRRPGPQDRPRQPADAAQGAVGSASQQLAEAETEGQRNAPRHRLAQAVAAQGTPLEPGLAPA